VWLYGELTVVGLCMLLLQVAVCWELGIRAVVVAEAFRLTPEAERASQVTGVITDTFHRPASS
jgi:hypothetical protein